MNLLNLFEDSNTPGLNYAEELAYQIFKAAPDLDATGAADEVLDYAFDLAVNDLGRKRAHSLFAYDEDFDGDLVTAYVDLQMNKSADDRKQADRDRLATGTNEGVAEGQLNEYLTQEGSPFADILGLNLFMDMGPDGVGFMEHSLVKKYKPIAGQLARLIRAQKKRKLTYDESDMIDNVWYDGSDAYDDMEVEFLADLYNQQIKVVKDILENQQGVAEGEVYDLEKEYGYEKPKTQPKRASVPPTRPSLHPEDTDFMDPVERRLRADQERVKAAWAAHNAKKGVAEGKMSELDAEYQDYKKLSPREFYNMYKMTKQQWFEKHKGLLQGVAETRVGNRMSDMTVGSPKIVYKNGRAVGEIGVDHDPSPGNGPYYMKHYDTNTWYSGYDSKKAALDDLKHVVNQMNEGLGGDMAKLVGIPVVAGAAAIGAQHYDDQQPHVEVGGQNAKIVQYGSSRIPDTAMLLKGQDGKMYRVWQQSGKGMNKITLASPAEPVKEGVTEANKKKEDEPEVRDVALQRAISRAKADFPTAGTGIEALAKDFMRSQDQDSKSFDQLRQAERKQDQMLAQISKIDQEQEQEIQDLEQQNSTLASRLQQLQSVNSELEKKLAAMSGRKSEKKSSSADIASAPVATSPSEPAKKAKAKSKNKPAPQKSAMKATAAQLAAPKVDPLAAMTQRITKGDQSIADKVTGQKSLAFEPSDNVLEPTISQRQVNPRFAAAKANASDVDPRYYADIAKKVAGSPEQFKAAMSGVRENNEEEAEYSDKYQDMVARVGQKAREQEKKKPVDIADLARRLAAIDASKKEK